IIKRFLGTFFFALSLIIMIAVVCDLTERMDDFIERKAPVKAIVFEYYLNFIPYFANLFSSLFIFISVIFFTSKLTANSEIIAIMSSGVSFKRLMIPYLISALVLALLSFFLSNFIIPQANIRRLEFEETYIRNPYRNFDINIHKKIAPDVFIYMESYNARSKIGYKFSMETFENKELKSKLVSDFIRWDTIVHKWKINNYYIRHFVDSTKEIIEKGRETDTVLSILPEDFERRESVVETMDYSDLNAFIDEQVAQGADNIETFLIEKYRRIAFPFSTFILTIIGLTLSIRKSKGGTWLHIGIGLLLSFSYIMFMQISTQFAINGGASPAFAVWVPNIIFSVIAAILYFLAPK
ncbi:MAG: LptF/LptG family permease, partial [Bacteroidetes bacterium]|nr:LptF/LptG family permease [Bacteroidota bacterium]